MSVCGIQADYSGEYGMHKSL